MEAIGRDLDAGDRGQDSPHRSPLEIYVFLLQWFSAAAERRSPKDGVDFAVAPTTKAKVLSCLRIIKSLSSLHSLGEEGS